MENIEKEVYIDDPEFEKYITSILRDKCLSRLCENCQFFNVSNIVCNIGYPKMWSLED